MILQVVTGWRVAWVEVAVHTWAVWALAGPNGIIGLFISSNYCACKSPGQLEPATVYVHIEFHYYYYI